MPDATKAAHYIQALDAARVEGNWSAVPEFVRKIRKHAPERECLALTAEIEHSISTVSKTPTAASSSSVANAQSGAATRPTTAATAAASTAAALDTATQLPKLLSIINKEDKNPQDVYQAKVCLGWLHWNVDEYGLAAVRLPSHTDYEQLQAATSGKLSDWTLVCALKAAYLKADCLSVEGQRTEALAVFETALPALNPIWDTRSSGKQLRYCSELFLTEFCMMHSRFLHSGQSTLHDKNSLGCFRAWAKYWDVHGGSVIGGHGFRGSVPRRRVWSEYYTALSIILDRDMPLPVGFKASTAADTSDRNQLRIELKKVEAAYEALLITETKFPRADENRQEVEEFTKSVFGNWAIMCGRGWREQDLGPGGREGISRGIIDLLYRAATKTYHSTTILRSLFTVHLAVSEFDLAFKAFDSYLDLIKHGKARVDKSGHAEVGLDDDATVLETISHCILALCRYGGREAIEKARDLGSELEDWLARLPQLRPGTADGKSVPEVQDVNMALHPEIPPSIVALSWQAIGLSQAHWTRVTYDAGLRTEIQTKAVRCLRRALAPELGRTRDVRTLFALGLLLAEKRELTPAIDIVKTALISPKSAEDDILHYTGPFWQERSLIPLWHLLALLLSARQEFMTAARACEGAFEQFRDTSVLFGDSSQAFKSDHLNELAANGNVSANRKGLVDELEDFERESILEIKMTQLTLVELLEGPDVAVNASFELLSLFSRLFGDIKPKKTAATANAGDVPQSSAGTLKSIRGSIFGSRSDKSGRTAGAAPPVLENQTTAAPSERPLTTQTTASGAPTIQVTGENGNATERKQSRKASSSQRRSRSNSGKRNSLKKRESSASRHRPPSLGEPKHSPTVVDGEVFFTPTTEPQQPPLMSPTGKRPPGLTFSREHTLSHAASYMSQASKSTVQSFSEISPDATYTITAPLPVIQFPQEQVRRHRIGILVKVWLMIAGFYRRADMYEDSRGAVAEAQKLVQGLDEERDASTGPTPKPDPGRGPAWAERKSLDELWGDVWAELGHLSLAEGKPYKARAEFESALTHFPDHPAATVGLADILLDVYTEKIVPEPTVPSLKLAEGGLANLSLSPGDPQQATTGHELASTPIGLGRPGHVTVSSASASSSSHNASSDSDSDHEDAGHGAAGVLPAPYKATSVPLLDRLAARDRASGLLTGLTKLGSAWDYSEAWFALARAHEESGLVEKAKEVLWWCVELEEGRGVREWRCLAGGGYVL